MFEGSYEQRSGSEFILNEHSVVFFNVYDQLKRDRCIDYNIILEINKIKFQYSNSNTSYTCIVLRLKFQVSSFPLHSYENGDGQN